MLLKSVLKAFFYGQKRETIAPYCLQSTYAELEGYKMHFSFQISENRGRKPSINSVHDIQPELLKVLHNLPPDFEIQVKNAEDRSGIKREYFVYGLSAFLALYMITGSEAGLFCNIICFTYPAVVSIQMDKAFSLLLYWMVFASFTFTDYYSERIMRIFPLYWIIKCTYCMYLYLPQTEGINIMEEKVIRPALQKVAKSQAGQAP
uniref:Receptor expression-enhancing protein n=1 Tax=Elaeophora elaphi TaxID=1147741 RepID=A0A0R3RRM6_9BILA